LLCLKNCAHEEKAEQNHSQRGVHLSFEENRELHNPIEANGSNSVKIVYSSWNKEQDWQVRKSYF
jgi:hypothetical protein